MIPDGTAATSSTYLASIDDTEGAAQPESLEHLMRLCYVCKTRSVKHSVHDDDENLPM